MWAAHRPHSVRQRPRVRGQGTPGVDRRSRCEGRVNKMKQRYSGYLGAAASLPEKPRDMWLRSYSRLLEKARDAEMWLEEARMGYYDWPEHDWLSPLDSAVA